MQLPNSLCGRFQLADTRRSGPGLARHKIDRDLSKSKDKAIRGRFGGGRHAGACRCQTPQKPPQAQP